MKYYDEERMQEIRLEFEERIKSFSGVEFKKMFGCPCYKHNGKLFAFLVTDGIVLTRLDEPGRQTLSKKFSVKGFSTGKRVMGGWPQVYLEDKKGLEPIMVFVKRSYDATRKVN